MPGTRLGLAAARDLRRGASTVSEAAGGTLGAGLPPSTSLPLDADATDVCPLQ